MIMKLEFLLKINNKLNKIKIIINMKILNLKNNNKLLLKKLKNKKLILMKILIMIQLDYFLNR